MSSPTHIPVMLTEVIEGLNLKGNGIYVDGTFGQGGYSKAILETSNCTLWGIDRDPVAVKTGKELEKKNTPRFQIIEGRFGDMAALLKQHNVSSVDGIALDIGVSSPQIDEAPRGFSFSKDGPLDMRMSQSGSTAADVVNESSEKELSDIFFHLGEERRARQVAKKIIATRAKTPITTTKQLADLIREVVPKNKKGMDPATKVFQALRIHVNNELDELDQGLLAAEKLLKPGGRLAVVSFHSLEDRRGKRFLKIRSTTNTAESRYSPAPRSITLKPSFTLVSRRAIKPTDAEIKANPRARSARLRVAERTDAPVYTKEGHA